MEEERVESSGISRRRMLKRIGAGAAIAWTAPVLTSLRTPAFAQYGCASTCTSCYSCGDPFCPGQPASTLCGGTGPVSDCGDICLCSATTEGDCFCGYNFGGDGVCSTSADCPPGYRCMVTCSGGCTATICVSGCTLHTATRRTSSARLGAAG